MNALVVNILSAKSAFQVLLGIGRNLNRTTSRRWGDTIGVRIMHPSHLETRKRIGLDRMRCSAAAAGPRTWQSLIRSVLLVAFYLTLTEAARGSRVREVSMIEEIANLSAPSRPTEITWSLQHLQGRVLEERFPKGVHVSTGSKPPGQLPVRSTPTVAMALQQVPCCAWTIPQYFHESESS